MPKNKLPKRFWRTIEIADQIVAKNAGGRVPLKQEESAASVTANALVSVRVEKSRAQSEFVQSVGALARRVSFEIYSEN